jgi:hypothetical protein
MHRLREKDLFLFSIFVNYVLSRRLLWLKLLKGNWPQEAQKAQAEGGQCKKQKTRLPLQEDGFLLSLGIEPRA